MEDALQTALGSDLRGGELAAFKCAASLR